MFIPTILSQGTDEQIAEFLPQAQAYEIIGTYAQTELGHGNYKNSYTLIFLFCLFD